MSGQKSENSTYPGVSRFGTLLRRYRTRRGITQQKLAHLSTVSVRAIRDLELGRAQQPRRDTVRLIATGLGLSDWERARLEEAADWQPNVGELRELFNTASAAPPLALAPLIGRDADVAMLSSLLNTGRQLVTVVGPCGIGKTRTALEVARQLHETDLLPVLWRAAATDDLSRWRPTTGPNELSTILRTELDALADPADAGVDELANLIGDHPVLLVLDEVSDIGTDSILALLGDCLELRVLATARTALGVHGEHTFQLGPLAVPPDASGPSVAELVPVESVQLFARHAVQNQPRFSLTGANIAVVADICRRVDGIPIALEAIADWLVVSSLDKLLDHVRTDPFEVSDGRLDDLRDAIDDALSLISDDEVSLLQDLTGTWTVADVTELTGWPPITCARVVRRLLTLGLIWQEPDILTRFHTFELARWLAVASTDRRVGAGSGPP